MEEKEKDMVTSEEELTDAVSKENESEVCEEEMADMPEEDEWQELEEAGEEEMAAEAEKSGKAKEKRGFRRKSREEKKTDALHERIAELEDKVKRQLAEFENFRNRTEKEKAAMFEIGAKSVIEKMLPVVDNFERGLAGLSEEEKGAPFAAGMQMVYKQLLTELDNLGVKPIEAVGKEFDPNLHNAVMQVESEEYESGVVAQEMMKGYMYRDNVVRHSMVAVVN